ncbi:MAG: DUF6272 family protein, partial [Bacteroidia bacterium]
LFDQEMVKSVLTMTEKKLIQDNVIESTRRKLFNIMMEGLQNICKHQLKTDDLSNNPFFIIGKNNEGFNIVTGNIIENSKMSIVKDKIDYINTLNSEELKEHYKKARLNSVISSVGGAGLGFIDMARKSGNKLDYRFYHIDTSYSYFILNNKINHN